MTAISITVGLSIISIFCVVFLLWLIRDADKTIIKLKEENERLRKEIKQLSYRKVEKGDGSYARAQRR